MSKKILVADDSLTIQKVVELTFADSEYRLTSVSNGRLALEVARRDPPDLILADVVMPEKNGYEVCDEIKRDPATSGIPVVLLAGTFEPFDRERAERLGCDAIVRKPFDGRDLFRKVDELLGAAPGRRRGQVGVPADAVVPATEGPAPRISEHFTPAPPNPFEARFGEEDFTGSSRPVRSGGRSRSEPRSDGSDSLASLYGPEDVDSALAAFHEVEAAAGSSAEHGRQSTDAVGEPRISRDSLAKFLGDAAADSGAMRESSPPVGAARDDERTRKIDVSGFRAPLAGERENFPGEPAVEIRRDDFFVPDPAARRQTPTPPPALPPGEPVPPLPTAGTAAPAGIAAAAAETAAAPPGSARELTDAEIDRLADRVAQKIVERLSDRVVREVAWEVVPDTAQLVVRERIRELESGVD